MGLFKYVKGFFKKAPEPKNKPLPSDSDTLKIILPGLYMSMKRPASYQLPHEVSMFIPRAEIRKSVEEAGKTTTWEVLLNSITMVHAPRHEPQGGSPSAKPGDEDDNNLKKV